MHTYTEQKHTVNYYYGGRFSKDYTGQIPAWRTNPQTAKAVWDGIKPLVDSYSTTSERNRKVLEILGKNIKSMDFQVYRQNCYHTGRGYTDENRYGITIDYGLPTSIVTRHTDAKIVNGEFRIDW